MEPEKDGAKDAKYNFLAIYQTRTGATEIREHEELTLNEFRLWLNEETLRKEIAIVINIYVYTGKLAVKTQHEVQGITIKPT